MKFLIKNKLMSIRGNSLVTDEAGNVVYKVKGSFWSNKITRLHKKRIYDLNKKKLFVVRNKFWHAPFHKSAIIFRKGKKLATVKTSHVFKNGFDVFGSTEEIKVVGAGWNLEIMLGDKRVGSISLPSKNFVRNAVRLADAFVLDVDDPEDAPFLVAMVIAVDNINDQRRSR